MMSGSSMDCWRPFLSSTSERCISASGLQSGLRQTISRLTFLWCLVVFAFSGCSQQEAPQNADSDARLMDELLGENPAEDSLHADAQRNNTSRRNGAPDPQFENTLPVSTVSNSSIGNPSMTPPPRVATARGERLELRLHAGDRFPLLKTVEQTLIQKSEQFPAVAQTKLSLMMALQVEQVTDSAILLSVNYNRITYAHDLNGQRLEYDSAVHQNNVPHDVLPYAGMINNGFSFWIGRDNKIRELVGYNEFLQRCVQNVTGERRDTLLAEISSRFGDDGVANFIDDSIGLLPYDTNADSDSATRVAPGDVWTREHRMLQPAPIYLTSTYRLMSINERTAEIDITGRIASGESVRQAEAASLKILGGHSLGKCTVDRGTGLPLQMDQTRFLSMIVTTADGQQIPQDKTIITTIRAFPEMKRPSVMYQPAQPPLQQQQQVIQPVAGSQVVGDPNAGRVSQIPVTPPPGAPVQAVYPQ
jgi:hypothetical protein